MAESTEAVQASSFSPEMPFGACDTVETVGLLKRTLVSYNIAVVAEASSLNSNGRDCVFIALKLGVRPSGPSNQRLVRDIDKNEIVNLDDMTVDDVREGIADHIVTVWEKPEHWATAALKIHIDNEARAYLNMQTATLLEVRDKYCAAIKGVNGCEKMFGDQACQLAFASRYSSTVVCWSPPRSTATTKSNRLFRPIMFGANAEVGTNTSRSPCLMMLYVLGEGVGHAEPLIAGERKHGVPSRFTSVSTSRVVCGFSL